MTDAQIKRKYRQKIRDMNLREVTLIVPEKTVDEYKAMARVDREKFLCADREAEKI